MEIYAAWPRGLSRCIVELSCDWPREICQLPGMPILLCCRYGDSILIQLCLS